MKKEFQTKKESVTQKPVKNNQGIVGPYPPTLTDIPMYDPQTGEPNPNYEKLTSEYLASLVFDLVQVMKYEMGLEDKEAWALLMIAVHGESVFKD